MTDKDFIFTDPTPNEIRKSFWKNMVITILRSCAGVLFLRYVVFSGRILKFVADVDNVMLQLLVIGFALAVTCWSFMAALELPINIPSYVSQMRRGCITEPVIRMYLYEMIPLSASDEKLTLSPSERWVVRSATDTVIHHLNTHGRK